MTSEEWIYVAALLDLSGRFYIKSTYNQKTKKNTRWQVRVRCIMTSKLLHDWLYREFGGVNFKKKGKLRGAEILYYWEVTDKLMEHILIHTLPYLKFVKNAAQEILEYRKNCYLGSGKGKVLTEELHQKRLKYENRLKKINEELGINDEATNEDKTQ